MNRQVDHIVHAGILLSLMCGFLFFINSVADNNFSAQNEAAAYADIPAAVENMPDAALQGKTLFWGNCASCHNVYKSTTGPALIGFTERDPWTDRKNVYAWIRNPQQFMLKNEYTRALKKQYNAMMTAFPDLTNEEIDAIIEYINFQQRPRLVP
jgi:mono/diheme cytochrome c family protein